MATDKKKKPSSSLPLFVGAIGFGIAAALLSVLYLNAKEKSLLEMLKGKEQQTVSVVVASQHLNRGSLVDEQYFSLRSMPADFVHQDVVYPQEFERYKGRSLTTDLGSGKALLKSFLDEEFPVDFSDSIKLGRRAMAVSVDEINSITGFLRPGNQIDLFVNIPYSESGFDPALYTVGLYSELPEGIDVTNISGGNVKNLASQLSLEDEKLTELLSSLSPGDVIIPVLQGVRVLATGKDPYIESLDHLRQPQMRRDENFTSIIVDVSTEQAALITAAQDKGDILAILRNRNDETASTFSSVSSRDLFTNAAKMAAAEKARASRATIPAGVDQFGNLVDADGKKILSKDQLAAAGYTINENGEIVDKDGNVIDPNDIVIAADGSIMTKQQLAAAGLTVNENGQIIDKDGNIVDVNDVVIAADGTILTKAQLEAAGLSVNANGEIVDSNGKVVSASDIIIAENGQVMTKEQLEAAGYSINESGQIVDANGNVVSSEQIAAIASEIASEVAVQKLLEEAQNELKTYELIIGGASTDGVPKTQEVSIPKPE
jgi:Flp pilus assembly protein CpaB